MSSCCWLCSLSQFACLVSQVTHYTDVCDVVDVLCVDRLCVLQRLLDTQELKHNFNVLETDQQNPGKFFLNEYFI